MTSATDELRRLLDERGVEWRAYTNLTTGSMDPYHSTYFNMPNGEKARVVSTIDGDMVVITFRATPEQAIAATLGTGTCRITDNGPWGYPYVCSECGASFDPDVNNGEYNYCPNCGRRIVEPTTNDVDAEVDA